MTMTTSARAEAEGGDGEAGPLRAVNGIRSDVSPDAPAEEQPVIGLIGMGEMGRMYATQLSRAGWMK